jgi:hypothetical protein
MKIFKNLMFAALLFSGIVTAQVGIGTNAPDTSALLDLSSTTKGFLLPRMTSAEQAALSNPAKGLILFNTTTNQIENNIGDGLGSIIWEGTATKGITAPLGTNNTQLATTEFVLANSNKFKSINATGDLLTTSTVDALVSGMTISPPAGTYLVSFNSQYNYSPGPTISAPVPVSTAQGVNDLQAAYDQIVALTTTKTPHIAVFGNGETLTAGVYTTDAAAAFLGTLTLDGQNNPNSVFIFRIGAAFNSGAGATVLLTNGASACNVFWVAEAAIGLGAITKMKGTIISHGAAVGAGAGCIIEGRMFTTAGALTLDNLTLTIPQNCSAINLGVLATFGMFTSLGNIANTAISALKGDVGTHSGLISNLPTSMVTGTIFPPGGTAQITTVLTPLTVGLATFSIYQNGSLIANSNRSRISTVNAADISLQAIATVTTGQAIDIRWKTDQGGLTLGNRIMTLVNVRE